LPDHTLNLLESNLNELIQTMDAIDLNAAMNPLKSGEKLRN